MSHTITIQAMSRKEITVTCNCSRRYLTKVMNELAKKNKDFKVNKGEKLSRTAVKILFTCSDILPQEITIEE